MELLSKAQRAAGGDPKSIREYARAAEAAAKADLARAKAQTQQAKTAAEIARAQKLLDQASRQAAAGQRKLGQEVEDATKEAKRATTTWASFLEDMQSGVAYDFASRGIQLVVDGLQQLISGAVEFASASVDIALQTRRWTSALESVLGSTSAATEGLDFAKRTANEFGIELGGATNAYVQMQASANSSNVTVEETNELFRESARAFALFGLNAETSGRAFTAISQVLSKGKLSAEELNQQLGEAFAPARSLVAEGLGISVQELTERMEDGAVTGRDFALAFTEGLKTLEGDVDPAVKAIANMQSAIRSVQEALGEMLLPLQTAASGGIAELIGAATAEIDVEALNRQLALLTATLRDNPEILQAIGQALGQITNVLLVELAERLAQIAIWMDENSDGIVDTVGALADGLQVIVQAVSGLIGLMIDLDRMTTAIAEAFLGLADATGISRLNDAILSLVDLISQAVAGVQLFGQEMRRLQANPFQASGASTAARTLSGATPGRATGGPISAGQAYNVGEKGAEPFISAQNGYILSHNDAVKIARQTFMNNPALAQPYLPDLSPAPGISTSKMEGLLGAIAQNTYPRNSSKPFSQIMRERQSGSYGRR